MIKRETRKRLIRIILVAIFLVGGVFAVQLQMGLVNVGQEFGTYGPYNRVLNVVEEMEDLELVNSRLRRKLELKFITTLENFAITVKDETGRKAVISFEKGTEAFDESDRERLKEIIIDRAEAGFSRSAGEN
jgi:hypothetical protein